MGGFTIETLTNLEFAPMFKWEQIEVSGIRLCIDWVPDGIILAARELMFITLARC
jgi:hypothetical protein